MTKTSQIEYINHYNAVRMRVTGAGNLILTLFSYDEVYSQELAHLAMNATTNRTPTQLANFTQQTAKLRIETDAIDEVFNISEIVVYSKPVGTSFPQ